MSRGKTRIPFNVSLLVTFRVYRWACVCVCVRWTLRPTMHAELNLRWKFVCQTDRMASCHPFNEFHKKNAATFTFCLQTRYITVHGISIVSLSQSIHISSLCRCTFAHISFQLNHAHRLPIQLQLFLLLLLFASFFRHFNNWLLLPLMPFTLRKLRNTFTECVFALLSDCFIPHLWLLFALCGNLSISFVLFFFSSFRCQTMNSKDTRTFHAIKRKVPIASQPCAKLSSKTYVTQIHAHMRKCGCAKKHAKNKHRNDLFNY